MFQIISAKLWSDMYMYTGKNALSNHFNRNPYFC